MDNYTPFFFIHVGKCGGSSVLEELNKKNITFTQIHTTRIKSHITLKTKKKNCYFIKKSS